MGAAATKQGEDVDEDDEGLVTVAESSSNQEDPLLQQLSQLQKVQAAPLLRKSLSDPIWTDLQLLSRKGKGLQNDPANTFSLVEAYQAFCRQQNANVVAGQTAVQRQLNMANAKAASLKQDLVRTATDMEKLADTLKSVTSMREQLQGIEARIQKANLSLASLESGTTAEPQASRT